MRLKQGGIPPTTHHQINLAEEQTGHASVDPHPFAAGQSGPALLRLSQVLKRTSLGRTYIYQLIKEGAFPRPVKVGSASLWVDQEISGWIVQLMANRGDGAH
jgi:prophage regulatory protein